MSLNQEQRERFARHINLPEIGEEGQEKLLAAHILLVGVGGLGSAAGFYLAAAGIGTIGLIDCDNVELCNLQRQILHSTADVGRPKVESAAETMRALHPRVTVHALHENLTMSNGPDILREYDFLIDATGDLAAKFLIADLCHSMRAPYSYGGILRFHGQTMTVHPGKTACLRCIFTQQPPPDTEFQPPQGPLGVLPGIIGTIQAAEALKHVLSLGLALMDRMLTIDVLTMNVRCIRITRNSQCPLCGSRPSSAVC